MECILPMQSILFLMSSEIYSNCSWCFVSSLLTTFLHCFDWVFLTFTIHNLYKIIMDPVEGILRPEKRLRIYLISSFIISGASTLIVFLTKIYGRSVRHKYNLANAYVFHKN